MNRSPRLFDVGDEFNHPWPEDFEDIRSCLIPINAQLQPADKDVDKDILS